jgi:hypothetical protein
VFGVGVAARRAHGRAGGWNGVGFLCSHFSLFICVRTFVAYDFECSPREQVFLPSSILLARTICKMEQRELEVTIISAQDLKNVSTFGKMTPYAVAWVYSNMKVSTPIDPKGSVNPTWNAPLKLIVEQRILEQPNATLNVDIYSHGSFSNKHVGSCSVPLSHLKEKDSKGADTKKFMSFLVCIC